MEATSPDSQKRVRANHLRGNTMNRTRNIIQLGFALTVFATVFLTSANAADPIADWNAITERAVKTAQHPLPVTSLEFAMVHLAIYDAVESIDRRYAPYHTLVP